MKNAILIAAFLMLAAGSIAGTYEHFRWDCIVLDREPVSVGSNGHTVYGVKICSARW
jgi:hypothetical protein